MKLLEGLLQLPQAVSSFTMSNPIQSELDPAAYSLLKQTLSIGCILYELISTIINFCYIALQVNVPN